MKKKAVEANSSLRRHYPDQVYGYFLSNSDNLNFIQTGECTPGNFYAANIGQNNLKEKM
jgi:hypothetical protein